MILALFVVFNLMLAAGETPDASSLIRKAVAAQNTQEANGWKFTYREEKEQDTFDKDGKVKETTRETFDVIMLEGDTYRKLVLVDGKPLDAKRQKQVDADLEKSREARKKARRFWRIRGTVSLGGLDLLERLFDCTVAGPDTVNGRAAWRVEAEPKTGYQAANKKEQEALSTRRTIWFDAEEGVELKSRNVFLRAANGFQPGSELETEYFKTGDAWLPLAVTVRYDLKAMAVARARGEARYRYYGYKRFQTESTLLP